MSISKNIPTKTIKYDNKLPLGSQTSCERKLISTDVSFVKGNQNKNKNRKVKS